MVCAEKNCKIKAKLYILKNKEIGYPDADGNLFQINTNKSLFTSDIHKIPEHLHKSYIKDFINRNFANIVKNDIFLKEDITHKYLSQYCIKYFLDNPDESTDKVLNKLSKLFNLVDENELYLFDYIKKGKQYTYDHINQINDYVNKLEDIKDNNNNKLANPYSYIDNDNKEKVVWLLMNTDKKEQIKNKYINLKFR